jgi:hypothetical protein
MRALALSLVAAMDYLAGLKAFSLEAQNSIEATLTSGQKLQFDSASNLTLQRPNKLVARRGKGDVVNQAYYYDGKTLSLYNPDQKVFATVAAPSTIEPTLDFARDKLDVVAPAADLLYRDAYEMLMQDTTVGFVVGKALVAGVPAAFAVEVPAAAPVMAQLLFVQNAASVEIGAGGKTLTLKGFSPTTLFFSDRPVRIAGHYRTEEYLQF